MKAFPYGALAILLLGSFARADDVRIEIRVTSAAGSTVYVDRGSANGLADGDRVQFRLDSGAIANGTIRNVSANSARVELDPLSARPSLGSRGEVVVPDSRPGASQAGRGDLGKPPVDHPPWTQAPESWDKDRPLLAPAFAITPEERESRLFGRAWLRYDGTWDAQGDRNYGLAAVGTDMTLENPFGDGGALRLDAEAFTRMSDVGSDDGLYQYDDTRVRLDRFSYQVGGTVDRPNQFLVGRFMQAGVPELGLLDGGEWNHRTDGGSEFGASVGWMPEPFPDRMSFQDLQAAIHYRHAFDVKRQNSVGIAYQNTWHDGEQDRNLFVLDAEARPSEELSLRAAAWVDLYDSADTIKGSGPELTQARFSGTWTPTPGAGVGLFLSEQRIPEILRDEFLARRADDVRNSVVDRIGLNGWTTVGQRTRLDARIEQWSDEADDGVNGEIGATFSELFGARSSLAATLQYADGSYSSGPGARLQARDTFGSTNVSLGLQSFWFSQKDYGGEDDQLAQHSLFGTVDVPLSDHWDLSFVGDRSIGDELDSWTVGFLLQTRF
ncbi:MAG: hypothetical protein NTY35_17360 [Planctomycetota bacterium]|nr:hypothetical protein [Planctomycetota bacterium]